MDNSLRPEDVLNACKSFMKLPFQDKKLFIEKAWGHVSSYDLLKVAYLTGREFLKNIFSLDDEVIGSLFNRYVLIFLMH